MSQDFTYPVSPGLTQGATLAVWNSNFEAVASRHSGTDFPPYHFPGMLAAVNDVLYIRDLNDDQWLDLINIAVNDGNVQLSGDTMTGVLDMGHFKAENLAAPSSATGLANKDYVDTAAGYEVGQYVGNGVNDRLISLLRIATTPSLIVVIRTDTDSGGPVERTGSMAANVSRFWSGTYSAGGAYIRSMEVGGFRVGTGSAVNLINGQYTYLAIA